MKLILVSILILFSFSSCKKVMTDDYEVKYYSDKTPMEIYYFDYSSKDIDTTVNATIYSVSSIAISSNSIDARIKADNSNMKIQIYRNDKLVTEKTGYGYELTAQYIHR